MLKKLIDDLRAVEDPAKRSKLASEALEAFKAANVEVSQIRQAGAQELKDQGLSLAEIGKLIGPGDHDLHFSRVQQILKGGKTGRWAKVAREAEEPRSPES